MDATSLLAVFARSDAGGGVAIPIQDGVSRHRSQTTRAPQAKWPTSQIMINHRQPTPSVAAALSAIKVAMTTTRFSRRAAGGRERRKRNISAGA